MDNDVHSWNWKLCCLCQSNQNEPLIDPQKTPKYRADITALKETFSNYVKNIIDLRNIAACPSSIVLASGIAGGGIDDLVHLMLEKNAVWHKTCKLKVNNHKVDRAKAQQKRKSDSSYVYSPVKTRKSDSYASGESCSSNKAPVCFFCNNIKHPSSSSLHKAATFQLDANVRRCANILGDKALIAKLTDGDLIALDAQYHLTCLTQLYRRANAKEAGECNDSKEVTMAKAQAYSELVAYLESNRCTGMVFKLAELCKMYKSSLVAQGLKDPYVHASRLCQDLTVTLPDLCTFKGAKSIDLAFDDDVTQAVMQMESNPTTTMMTLAKASKILREQILDTKYNFTGTFEHGSDMQTVPPLLLHFMQMVMDGPKKQGEIPGRFRPAAVAASEMIVYNSVKRNRSGSEVIPRHIQERESPLMIYNAIKSWCLTGKESLVDALHANGMSISYKRLSSLTTHMANSVISFYHSIGMVVPPQARRGVFTILAYDNYDDNPSCTTNMLTSTHGTGLSIHQFPKFPGQGRRIGPDEILSPELSNKKTIDPLPVAYTAVAEIFLPSEAFVPKLIVSVPLRPPTPSLSTTIADQYQWLEHVYHLLDKKDLSETDWISWAAYHADLMEQDGESAPPRSSSWMLPLFKETATNPELQYHCMRLAKRITEALNPGQHPVWVVDQPLYLIAKKLQWLFPDEIGEDKFVVLLGGLHIEKMLLTLLGNWFSGTGWTTALTNAQVASSGVAQSFLGACHITRTRYSHQVIQHPPKNPYRYIRGVPRDFKPLKILNIWDL